MRRIEAVVGTCRRRQGGKVRKRILLRFDRYDKELYRTLRSIPGFRYNADLKDEAGRKLCLFVRGEEIVTGYSIPYANWPLLIEKIPASDIKVSDSIRKQFAVYYAPPSQSVRERLEATELETNDFQFKLQPYKHQIEAFNSALRHKNLLLADDQGLGKTMEAINIALYRKQQGKVRRCLVVCGINGTKYNWKSEVEKHSDEKCVVFDGPLKKKLEQIKKWRAGGEFFGIINIEAIRNLEIAEALDNSADLIILDEAHKAKNSKSKQGLALAQIGTKYKLALTGTPITASLVDLHNILVWLEVEDRTLDEFKETFRHGENYKLLQYNLSEVMLRRLKQDAFDLPNKVYSTEYVEMTDEQRRKYKEIDMGLLKYQNQTISITSVLAELVRYQQVADGLFCSSSPKVDRIRELVSECIIPAGAKVVIYSRFKGMVDRLADALDVYEPEVVTGDMKNPKLRQQAVDRFQNNPECQVIIGTIGALGTGFTLSEAEYVIFVDKMWSPAVNLQAEDRAHRIGTRKPVHIISMVCMQSRDDQMEEYLRQQQVLFDSVLNHGSTIFDQRKLLYALFGERLSELNVRLAGGAVPSVPEELE